MELVFVENHMGMRKGEVSFNSQLLQITELTQNTFSPNLYHRNMHPLRVSISSRVGGRSDLG